MTKLEDWIGKQQTRSAVIDEPQARKLAVTLDLPTPKSGDPLPACWHWAWFNDELPASELGRDGHPQRGGFIPPIELPRRMWAGGEISLLKPVLIGKETGKCSTIKSIKHRKGNSGDLCIVAIEHVLSQGENTCIKEIQNLVFREDPKPGDIAPDAPSPPDGAEIEEAFTPDPVMMFRYSALTFNGHRIHYDVDYARDVEGYPDLVFHAPLTATMLYAAAQKLLGDTISNFKYRATAPLFCNSEIRVCAKREGRDAIAWAQTPSGGQAMIAEVKG